VIWPALPEPLHRQHCVHETLPATALEDECVPHGVVRDVRVLEVEVNPVRVVEWVVWPAVIAQMPPARDARWILKCRFDLHPRRVQASTGPGTSLTYHRKQPEVLGSKSNRIGIWIYANDRNTFSRVPLRILNPYHLDGSNTTDGA